MRFQLILLLSIFCHALLNADNINYPAGARSSALATASVSLTDIWSSFNNQAGLAWLSTPSLGCHFENKFLVREYALHAGAIAIPLKPGTGGLNYRYFGYSKYHEAKVGLTFARKFHKTVSAGVQLNYHQTYLAEGYGNYNALTVEIGLMFTPVKDLFIGAHVFNPNRAKSNADNNEYIPTVYRVGGGYTVLNQVLILLETEKYLDQKPVLKGGLEIEAVKNLDLRFGVGSGYMEYTFGLGYRASRFSFDLAFSHHSVLGFTPHASLMLSLGKSHD